MIYGGYPAIITEPDKQEKINRLKEIRDSFVKRDILEAGVLNETAFYNLFRILDDKSGIDGIQYWRTSGGNEVDFVLSDTAEIKAIEVKYDKEQLKVNKYKLFRETYPDIPIQFVWLQPFDQDFFRRVFVS